MDEVCFESSPRFTVAELPRGGGMFKSMSTRCGCPDGSPMRCIKRNNTVVVAPIVVIDKFTSQDTGFAGSRRDTGRAPPHGGGAFHLDFRGECHCGVGGPTAAFLLGFGLVLLTGTSRGRGRSMNRCYLASRTIGGTTCRDASG